MGLFGDLFKKLKRGEKDADADGGSVTASEDSTCSILERAYEKSEYRETLAPTEEGINAKVEELQDIPQFFNVSVPGGQNDTQIAIDLLKDEWKRGKKQGGNEKNIAGFFSLLFGVDGTGKTDNGRIGQDGERIDKEDGGTLNILFGKDESTTKLNDCSLLMESIFPGKEGEIPIAKQLNVNDMLGATPASFAQLPQPPPRLTWQQAVIPLEKQTPPQTPTDLPPPHDDDESWAFVRCQGDAFRDGESLRELLLVMMRSSEFVYMYAAFRRMLMEHHVALNGDGNVQFDSPFDTPELVQDLFFAERKVSCRLLERPIPAATFLDFLRRNRKYLGKEFNGALGGFNPQKWLFLEDTVDLFRANDGRLLDYDDEFTASGGLVYGITSNRLKKRLTVVFRGSVGQADFITCANYRLDGEVFAFAGPEVKIHAGFASYLFGLIEGGETKFRRIVDCLKYYYDNAPPDVRDDFDLYVSGHSLGGALAILFASAVAATEASHPVFRKIRVVTFAAPLVGNQAFDRAVRNFEKRGTLKLMRISNDGDVIATRHLFREYIANGVNMHLRTDGTMELKRGNTKHITTQIFGDFLVNHSFPEHERRLFLDAQHSVLDRTYDEVYRMGGVCDFDG